MYCVVCIVSCRYQVFRIQQNIGTMNDVISKDWIHVMNDCSAKNIEPLNPEITAIVPEYNEVANTSPFLRMVEFLIQISLKAEGLYSDLSVKAKVVEAFGKRAHL